MSYINDFRYLKKIFNQVNNVIPLPDSSISIENYHFSSADNSLSCYETLNEKCSLFPPNASKLSHLAEIDDSKLKENNSFTYSVFRNNNSVSGAILLLHGLNERCWDKYLPWAKKLVELTGKSVILFPISFHMNRAPVLWSNHRLMNQISKERMQIYPGDISSSFVNAAISTRLQYRPQRFFRSGLKTIYDIIKLIGCIKKGGINGIRRDAGIDLFGYSIGAFISEILFLANPLNYFADSRLFLFCGGPVFEKMRPVSRFIIDKIANESLRSYYVECFQNNINSDSRLRWFFRDSNTIANAFTSMLNLDWMKSFRESRLKEISSRIVSLSLLKDYVMPSNAVNDTLNGTFNNPKIKTIVKDFPYDYDHVNPFPVIDKIEDLVDKSFNSVFELASSVLA